MMNGFDRRVKQHDEIALPFVVEKLETYEFECFMMGTEGDSSALHQSLMSQSDRTSIMLRFRPDRVFIKQGMRSVLCEVKSENKGYKNFAIEIDSYQAANEWNKLYNHVMYAFVDLSQSNIVISSCWAGKLPFPKKIYVPRRWDFEHNYHRLQREFPNAILSPTQYKSGKQSGTPYYLVSKRSSCLISLDSFIANELVAHFQLELL